MAIKHKITLSVSLLLILILVAFWLALKLQLQQTVAQQTDTLGNILARQTADSVTELVLANDVLGLNVVVNQLARENGVANITISDVDGRELTSTARQGLVNDDASAPYVAPVTLQGAIAGYVSLSLDESFLTNPVTRPDTMFFVIIGAGLVLVFAASHAIAAQVTTPLLELVRMTEADEETEPEALAVTRSDEFGLLQQRIADLIWRQRELEEQIDVIGAPREDPEDTAGLKAERRTVTLLHVEVANSAKALDLLHPGTLSTLLQQYQFYLRQAARLYRGVVVRVNGDSALVAFDTRRCQDEHAFDALCCAQLFMRLMQKVAEDQRARKAQALEFCVAVFSGDAYFSPIWRKQKGEDERRQESVIGKSVDFVMELATHCHAGEIIVSESSFALADGNNRFGAQQSRKVALDSGNINLVIYTVPAHAGTHSELLDRQRQHLLPDQGQAHAAASPAAPAR